MLSNLLFTLFCVVTLEMFVSYSLGALLITFLCILLSIPHVLGLIVFSDRMLFKIFLLSVILRYSAGKGFEILEWNTLVHFVLVIYGYLMLVEVTDTGRR